MSEVAFGVLALQGDFAAHAAALAAAGARARPVRHVAELDGLSGLVLPGGESTALLKLMAHEPWFDALGAFHAAGGALFGTCAGAILLAREVEPSQPSLGLLDAGITRNAYGRQLDSFEADLALAALDSPLRVAFIRAPRFHRVGPGVLVLARHAGAPVLLRAGRVLCATFHPEVTGDARLHALFVALAAQARAA